jgi:type IV pilus assembly protein PilN
LGVGLLGLLTLILLGLVIRGWVSAGRDRHTIAQLQAQIAERDNERASAQAFLELASNRSTRDQSQFLNGLIRRKAFSWTRVFEELELVMPNDLHAVSLKPELNDQNQVELEMTVACQNRAAAIELVHRMEGSKHFQGSQLVKESQGDNAAGVAATVSAIYVPNPADKGGK